MSSAPDDLAAVVISVLRDLGHHDASTGDAPRMIAELWAKNQREALPELHGVEKMREALKKVAGGSFVGASNLVMTGDWQGFTTALQGIARAALAQGGGHG